METLQTLRSKRQKLLTTKSEIDGQIKAITREILRHPDLGIDLESIQNKGGSSNHDGLHISFTRSLSWDQEYLATIKGHIAKNDWPFKTKETLGLRDFQNFAMESPGLAEIIQKGAITKVTKTPRLVEKEVSNDSNA